MRKWTQPLSPSAMEREEAGARVEALARTPFPSSFPFDGKESREWPAASLRNRYNDERRSVPMNLSGFASAIRRDYGRE